MSFNTKDWPNLINSIPLNKEDRVAITLDTQVLEKEGTEIKFIGRYGTIFHDYSTNHSSALRVQIDNIDYSGQGIPFHLMRWMKEIFPIWTPEVGKRVRFSYNVNVLNKQCIPTSLTGTVEPITQISRDVLTVGGLVGKYLLHFFPLEEYYCPSNPARPILNSTVYCSCSSPLLIQSFTGLSGGGIVFNYCKNCGKEKI